MASLWVWADFYLTRVIVPRDYALFETHTLLPHFLTLIILIIVNLAQRFVAMRAGYLVWPIAPFTLLVPITMTDRADHRLNHRRITYPLPTLKVK